MSKIECIYCCNYTDNYNDNLCYNCEHPKDYQCHKSRDTLNKELYTLKEEMDTIKSTQKGYRVELSNEIASLIKANAELSNEITSLKKTNSDFLIALDAEKEYRNDLIKSNNTLEVVLISAYIVIAIFAALLMLK